jgi:hypothetical protein
MSDNNKIKGAAPREENAPSKYTSQENTKESSILKVLLEGRSLNRFEAEPLGDHCLHSTIATLRSKGYLFYDQWERVPTRFNKEVRVKRYRYVGSGREQG